MLITDKIPEYIYRSLSNNGVSADDIMLASYCDMNSDHALRDTYVIATGKSIYVISGHTAIEKSNKKSRIEVQWHEESFVSYDIDTIKEMKVEDLLSGARLAAVTESGDNIFVCAMTNTCRASALLFIKYFERMKKGEIVDRDFEVDAEDDPSSHRCPKCSMRYPDKNRKVCPKCMEKGKLYRRFGMFLLKYKKHLAIILASLVLLTATGILVPYFSNQFFHGHPPSLK